MRRIGRSMRTLRKIGVTALTIALISNGALAQEAKKIEHPAGYAEKITEFSGLTPAQWRVLWKGDASTEATISWSTAEEGEKHVVHYGTVDRGSDIAKYEKVQTCDRSGLYTVSKEGETSGYYHHARLTGLKPATKYFFVLESDGNFSKRLYFMTAPAKGTDFSIIHGGDSRSGHSARCQINEMIADMVSKDPGIMAFAHGGDYIGSGRQWSLWSLWLSHHELTTGKDGRVLPFIPAIGNHDGGPLYKEIFDILPDQPNWYTTSFGKDVALVTLDTCVGAEGAQSEWLEGELKRLRPTTKWLLTQYHHPLYPAVKNPPKHKEIFCPLFEKYNVDLACEADGHCIKRTLPIRADKLDPTGVTYIGEGGLGVGQRPPKTDRWYLEGGVLGADNHVMELGFSDKALRIQVILLGGKVFDDHSLNVRK